MNRGNTGPILRSACHHDYIPPTKAGPFMQTKIFPDHLCRPKFFKSESKNCQFKSAKIRAIQKSKRSWKVETRNSKVENGKSRTWRSFWKHLGQFVFVWCCFGGLAGVAWARFWGRVGSALVCIVLSTPVADINERFLNTLCEMIEGEKRFEGTIQTMTQPAKINEGMAQRLANKSAKLCGPW